MSSAEVSVTGVSVKNPAVMRVVENAHVRTGGRDNGGCGGAGAPSPPLKNFKKSG
jgi:hypothetical protein